MDRNDILDLYVVNAVPLPTEAQPAQVTPKVMFSDEPF